MPEVITGFLQEYPWGSAAGMSEVLPADDPRRGADGPQAELWFGAHPRGPSPLRDAASESLLDRLPSEGAAPILVKILAAGRPLSIQVHPSARLAAELLAAGDAGLADDRAKEEMLISLDGFDVYCGMRDASQSAALFAELAAQVPQVPLLEAVAGQLARQEREPDPSLGEPGWCAAVRLLLTLSVGEVEAAVAALPQAAAVAGINRSAVKGWIETAEAYPGDAGTLVAATLRHRVLEPGECSYVPTGVVHAYIRGYGIEVMTNSDNVLRLGLTGKQIAMDEALSAVDTTREPVLIDAELEPGGALEYTPAGAPFEAELSAGGDLQGPPGAYRLLLCIDGQTTARVGAGGGEALAFTLAPGEALALWEDDAALAATVTGHAVLASATR